MSSWRLGRLLGIFYKLEIDPLLVHFHSHSLSTVVHSSSDLPTASWNVRSLTSLPTLWIVIISRCQHFGDFQHFIQNVRQRTATALRIKVEIKGELLMVRIHQANIIPAAADGVGQSNAIRDPTNSSRHGKFGVTTVTGIDRYIVRKG